MLMADSTLIIQFQCHGVLGLIAGAGRGRPRIERTFSLPLAPGGGEAGGAEFSRRLRKELGAKGGRPLRRALLVLHRQDLALLELRLPPGTPAETAQMLELELADRIPLEPARVCYGWELVDRQEDGRQTIQVYWTPQQKIAPLMAALGNAGLEVAGVLPALALYRRQLRTEGTSDPLAFIHCTPQGFEAVCWGAQGTVLFSLGRMVAQAASAAGDHDPFPAGHGAELSDFIQASCRRFELNGELRKLYVGSEPADAGLGLGAEANALDHPALARTGQVLEALEASDRLAFLPLVLAAELASAFATRPGGGVETVNMLPRSLSASREASRARSLTLQVAGLILSIVALAAGNLWLYAYQMKRQLAASQAEMARLAPQVKEVEAMEGRIHSIREQLDYVLSPADAVRKINEVLAEADPALEGLYLDHMNYKSTGEIMVEGHATNDITPWKLAEALDKSAAFQITQKPRIQTRQYGETRSIRYSLAVVALGQGERAPAEPGREEAP